jgi:diguanylate cyclase (GGDEF)-like protein
MDHVELIDRVRAAIKRDDKGMAAICLVRLDRLAHINELIGYESAGLLLDEFKDRLQGLVRRTDSLITMERHKMVLVMRGLANEQHLALAANKLERLFDAPIEVIADQVKVAVHAGFVMANDDTVNPEDLLRRAESALRQAQESRRTWVLSNDATPLGEGIDWAFQRKIEAALADGQFNLHHQPKCHANYGTIIGAESLLRWHSPTHGMVPPDEFIPAAERSGVIGELTWFTIKAAVAQCSQWPQDMGIAVNISPCLLDGDEIVQVVRDALVIFDVAPPRLTLEVTESGIARNRDRAFALLAGLREHGIRVAIDDFGTGYSSFAHFRDIPADELKIDRAFVSRMRDSSADARIVKSIIDLAHNFALKVVAEGVEDAATAEDLKQLGCDYLQGYWLGKPMAGPDFDAWLKRKLGVRGTVH